MSGLLLEALISRSSRGLWLSLQPVLYVVLLVFVVRALEVLFPLTVTVPLGLLTIGVWCVWMVAALSDRAAEVATWLRQRVDERGGDGSPAQPVTPPSTLEVNERNAPRMLASLEAVQLAFMRHPGRDSRRGLALAALALAGQLVVSLALEAPTTLATQLCAVVATLAIINLFVGRRRQLPCLWRQGAWPWLTAWIVADRPSKVLGPLWLGLALLFFAATVPISHARSVEQGVSMAFHLSVPLSVLWVGRRELLRVGTIERTNAHRVIARLIAHLAPFVWWAVLAAQVVLLALGIAALALAPIDENGAYLGVLLIGIAVMVRSMRLDWRRPHKPTVVDIDDVAALLGEPHLERRITLVLMAIAAISGIWFYLLEAT